MADVIDITPEGRLFDKMERDQFDPAALSRLGGFAVVGAILKSQGAVMRDLNQARQTPIHGAFLFLWFLILLFVALQMAYYFRPLLLPGPFHIGERGLFFEAVGRLLE